MASASTGATARQGVVTASTLNVRGDPSTAQPPIGQLARGAQITILETIGSWYKIAHTATPAFVYGDFVHVFDAQPVAGFLAARPDLRAVALEAPAGQRIQLSIDAPSDARTSASIWNAHGGLLQAVSDIVAVGVEASVAVVGVESGGRGFHSDGRLLIRFENHVFWRRWGKENTQVFSTHFQFDREKPWQGHQFRANDSEPWLRFHGRQADEWRVFEFARGLHEVAALNSISMGASQIMGFNHGHIGYDSVREMFDAFTNDVRFHLLGLFDFVKGPGETSPMLEALHRGKLEVFAAGYNGPGQAAEYGARLGRLREAFAALRGDPA